MLSQKRILTLHPQGLKGVNILESKYKQISKTIIKVLGNKRSISFTELNAEVKKELKDKFDGSISWYVTTVKLDLEARKIVKRSIKNGKQVLSLK